MLLEMSLAMPFVRSTRITTCPFWTVHGTSVMVVVVTGGFVWVAVVVVVVVVAVVEAVDVVVDVTVFVVVTGTGVVSVTQAPGHITRQCVKTANP